MTAPAVTADTQYDPYGRPVKAPSAPTTPAPLSLATGNQTAGNTTQYASVMPHTPGGAGNYLGQTIQPGPSVDRIALAQRAWDASVAAGAPAYESALRSAKSEAAGVGQLGSGMLRTRIGDLGLARQRDMDQQRQQLMNDAITGSISDQYQNLGIAQQQQGFQAAQQTTDFAQRLAEKQQGLAGTLGLGNLGVAQQQANTAQAGTLGSLGLSHQQLAQQGQQFGQTQEQQEAEALLDRAHEASLQKAGLTQETAESKFVRDLQERMQGAGLTQETEQNKLMRELQEKMQGAGFKQETDESKLMRELQDKMQGAGIDAEAEQNEFMRNLQEKMQVAGFTQETAEQLLDRKQETDQNKLMRDLHVSMQKAGFTQETAEQELNRKLDYAGQAVQAQSIANQLALGKYSNVTERDNARANQELAKQTLWMQLLQILGVAGKFGLPGKGGDSGDGGAGGGVNVGDPDEGVYDEPDDRGIVRPRPDEDPDDDER